MSENGTHFEGEIDCEPRNWGPEIGLAVGKFIIVAGGGLLVGILYGFIGKNKTNSNCFRYLNDKNVRQICDRFVKLLNKFTLIFSGAYLTKFTKHAPIIEPLIVYACAYLAYLTAGTNTTIIFFVEYKIILELN